MLHVTLELCNQLLLLYVPVLQLLEDLQGAPEKHWNSSPRPRWSTRSLGPRSLIMLLRAIDFFLSMTSLMRKCGSLWVLPLVPHRRCQNIGPNPGSGQVLAERRCSIMYSVLPFPCWTCKHTWIGRGYLRDTLTPKSANGIRWRVTTSWVQYG